MPTNRPNARELVEAVREFLEEKVQPAIEGQVSFHAKIAANILKIVERELSLGPNLNQAESERLKELLKQDGDLESLNTVLCEKLKAGELDYRDPALKNHLKASVLGKLAIDNPEYSAYKRAIERKTED